MIKRIFLLGLITVLCAFITACQEDRANSDNQPHNNGQNDRPANNEIKDMHGMVENIERLDLFVKNMQSGKKDKVRLTRFTIEGDPIFHDLDYNGSKLEIKVDTTKDKFGQGEIITYVCKGIQKHESNTETKYSLIECPNLEELLTISHDVDQQDYFAFELKYGVGMKNIIDTKDQRLVKDLQNGETIAVSDFQFSKEEMNKIYKLMILSNYLGEKKLNKECNQEPYKSYELNVWINSGERQFEWSECDKSPDGKEMIELVHDILDILKNNSTYQSLPEVKGSYE
ncbi:DUF4362 domain-containing protein [Neobacillus soli]|uniref:DUF4362 domain-containing protein n=1 Tax=Neobacillus soli TaxID=220688 RepID=UPI000825CBFF|nr:DUF4362 domain-containing protein [Neobacillus soli]